MTTDVDLDEEEVDLPLSPTQFISEAQYMFERIRWN